jgi:hypothetical protein
MTNVDGEKNKEKILQALRKHKDCIYINDIYRMVLSLMQHKKNEVSYKELNTFDRIFTTAILIAGVIVSGMIMLINMPFKKRIDCNQELAFARAPRVEVKIRRFKENVQIITDDIKKLDFSVYRIGSRRMRIRFLCLNYIKSCLKDYKDVYKITLDKEMVPYGRIVLKAMAKRIPHTVVYRYSVDMVLKNYQLEKIFTGQMCDRFALVEWESSKKYGKYLVCVPHGVEFTAEMPAGYVGNKFYCTSSYTCDKLKKLYKELYKDCKYVYSDMVANKLFSVQVEKHSCCRDKKVVFFTQPSYQLDAIGVIGFIAGYLKSVDRKLYLKLHPQDRRKHYNNISNIAYIEDFEKAICNNVCIAVTSTALLEGVYNGSVAISIVKLIDKDCRLIEGYAFLNDERIFKPSSKRELVDILKNVL